MYIVLYYFVNSTNINTIQCSIKVPCSATSDLDTCNNYNGCLFIHMYCNSSQYAMSLSLATDTLEVLPTSLPMSSPSQDPHQRKTNDRWAATSSNFKFMIYMERSRSTENDTILEPKLVNTPPPHPIIFLSPHSYPMLPIIPFLPHTP